MFIEVLKGLHTGLQRSHFVAVALLLLAGDFLFLGSFIGGQTVSAAGESFRTTTYEFEAGEFTGTDYTLTLNNDLSTDYFTMISGPSAGTGTRGPNADRVRVSQDPFGNFIGTPTAADEITLSRGNSTDNWIGALTVVECLLNCSTKGFTLSEVLSTDLAVGTANAPQTITDTLASNYTAQTVPFGGRFGGGMSTTGAVADAYAVTAGVKLTKTNSNEIQFERYGAENRAPSAATITTYIVEWGSEWNIQDVNVTGTAAGGGSDQTANYDSAAISSVARLNTWVWGGGHARDDGLGDGALGQIITLGDGANQNTNETLVSVSAEGGQIAPGRDFQIYVLEHPDLAVDHRFKVLGDSGASNGYQELTQTINSAQTPETYDNTSATVRSTEGRRIPLFYNSSSGVGQAYSRTGAWGLRITADNTIAYWRAYSGQNVSGWFQSVDFGQVKIVDVDNRQQAFRWRDDSTDLNTTGGWLAAEDTNLADQAKNTSLRLRMKASNFGTTPETAGKAYELQFGDKGFGTCSAIGSWVGISDSATDDFELYNSPNIDPDGEITTTELLSNADGFTYVNGEGREVADTTNTIGPISDSAYTELEFALRPTDNAVTGKTYCFRLFDTSASLPLDGYTVYPELTVSSTSIDAVSGLGEAGTFTSAVDGGWTTVNFDGSYTSPVVVGTTNTQNGQNSLVFEARNVTGTTAEMRVCESEGAAANGCDTHAAETVGYMVVDADVAATTDGIEAGTFTATGDFDTDAVTTTYPSSFSSTPYVFANANTVNSANEPVEVMVRNVTSSSFISGLCHQLVGANLNECNTAQGSETVGWIAIEPGNEPFSEQTDTGDVSIASSAWTGITFSSAFPVSPVVIVESQTDNGGEDAIIDEARLVTTTGADVRYCEMEQLDTCDTHAADDVAWFAIEPGQFSAQIDLDQDGYRFYENTNNITPAVALGAENTAIANVDTGDELRIRVAVQAGGTGLVADALEAKLQYGSGATCSAVGVWTDVGAIGSGEIWRGSNNGPVTDGDALPSTLLDGGSNIPQTYEEENNAALNPNALAAGTRGEWDWVIENNGAANFTQYCFRMVTVVGDIINYASYPQLTTSTGVANLAPNAPTNLDQERTTGATIAVGELINTGSVVFIADISDQNANDIIELCVEVKEVDQVFIDIEDSCSSTYVYSGSAVAAELTLGGYEHNTSYHWQARVKDSSGLYSAWVEFGGNPTTDDDFDVDTVDPEVLVYDGTVLGADLEFNDGSLDTLSGVWELQDDALPGDVAGLSLWLDGQDVNNTGVDPVSGASISTWVDRSGNANNIAGTGNATFNATERAVEFDGSAQPFNDTFDRSGGNANSQTIFSIVTGDATDTNAVWYETTTPRVAPGEQGILGAGTQLSDNRLYSSFINSKRMVSLEFLSTGTSSTWLDRSKEFTFTETQAFANSQQIVIGDDTIGGNPLNSSEFVHEILVYNQDLTPAERKSMWNYLECKWDLKNCDVTYEYSIGTSPDGTDVMPYTSTGSTLEFTNSGLSLETSEIYYINIRATDAAGNQKVFNADGIQVAPTLVFSTSTNTSGVQFGGLNGGNSFTATEDTVLTTSTNARNGYVIRARITGSLENALLQTIDGFDGGTYAAPDAWQSGDTGYGYTSSDTSIQGVDLFNALTCPGGGSGSSCFAPFTTNPIGDIVADNPGPVTGTAIDNEQFTISHRVTTDAAQSPGVYQTTLIFQATANY